MNIFAAYFRARPPSASPRLSYATEPQIAPTDQTRETLAVREKNKLLENLCGIFLLYFSHVTVPVLELRARLQEVPRGRRVHLSRGEEGGKRHQDMRR